MLTEQEAVKIIDKCIFDLDRTDDMTFVSFMEEMVNRALDARDARADSSIHELEFEDDGTKDIPQ